MHSTIDWIIEGQELYSVSPDVTVLEAARYMAERRIGAVSVLDNGRLVGIISERDLMTKVVAEGRDPKSTRAREVMSHRLVHGKRGDTYHSCIEKMLDQNCRHLPILDEDRVVGMVSIRDLYRVEATEMAEEIEHMTAYMYSSPKVAKGSI
jgi:CBS domain-containing protein